MYFLILGLANSLHFSHPPLSGCCHSISRRKTLHCMLSVCTHILPALCITPPYSFVTQEYNTWDTVMPAPFAIVARPCISNGNNQGDSPIRQMWQWSLPPGTPLCECRVHGLGGFGKER